MGSGSLGFRLVLTLPSGVGDGSGGTSAVVVVVLATFGRLNQRPLTLNHTKGYEATWPSGPGNLGVLDTV